MINALAATAEFRQSPIDKKFKIIKQINALAATAEFRRLGSVADCSVQRD